MLHTLRTTFRHWRRAQQAALVERHKNNIALWYWGSSVKRRAWLGWRSVHVDQMLMKQREADMLELRRQMLMRVGCRAWAIAADLAHERELHSRVQGAAVSAFAHVVKKYAWRWRNNTLRARQQRQKNNVDSSSIPARGSSANSSLSNGCTSTQQHLKVSSPHNNSKNISSCSNSNSNSHNGSYVSINGTSSFTRSAVANQHIDPYSMNSATALTAIRARAVPKAAPPLVELPLQPSVPTPVPLVQRSARPPPRKPAFLDLDMHGGQPSEQQRRELPEQQQNQQQQQQQQQQHLHHQQEYAQGPPSAHSPRQDASGLEADARLWSRFASQLQQPDSHFLSSITPEQLRLIQAFLQRCLDIKQQLVALSAASSSSSSGMVLSFLFFFSRWCTAYNVFLSACLFVFVISLVLETVQRLFFFIYKNS
jgi:hypothetical protein